MNTSPGQQAGAAAAVRAVTSRTPRCPRRLRKDPSVSTGEGEGGHSGVASAQAHALITTAHAPHQNHIHITMQLLLF